jgi:hypothetical protein
MSAPVSHVNSTEPEQADLTTLAAALAARGYQATLHTAPDRLPFLHVCNPRASVLSERVYAQADSFWFSWAERIAGCDEADAAAGILARVLHAPGSE